MNSFNYNWTIMKKMLIYFCLILPSRIISMEPAKKVEPDVCLLETSRVIDALNIQIPHFNPTIKIMSYNVDKAVREEQFPNTKWSVRAPRIIRLINEVNADIVCLQELRHLQGASPSDIEFLAQLAKYKFVTAYRDPGKGAFGLATLYDPEKFYPMISFPRWFSDTPEKISNTWAAKKETAYGTNVLCTQFRLVSQERIVENSSPFWVFNVHFALDEETKTKSAHKLIEIIKEATKGQPFIVCGDFNFFWNLQGNNQRNILTSFMKDLGINAETLAGKRTDVTFVGYEHDNFKTDLCKAFEINLQPNYSRLDHIFGSKTVEKIGVSKVYTKTMLETEPQEFKTRDYPSDHLPLIVEVKLFKKD